MSQLVPCQIGVDQELGICHKYFHKQYVISVNTLARSETIPKTRFYNV